MAGRSAEQNQTLVRLLGFAAGATPVMSLLSANALAPFIIGLAVVILVIGRRGEILRQGPRWLAVALGLLAVLGLASAAWSVTPESSLRKVLQLLPLFATSYLLLSAATSLPAGAGSRIGRWLTIGTGCAVLFVIAEAAAGGILNHLIADTPFYAADSLARYKRGAVVIAVLALPAAHWVWRELGRLAATALLAGVAVGAFLVQSGTALGALAIGLSVALLVAIVPRVGRYGLAAVLALVIIASPLVRFAPAEIPPDTLREIHVSGLSRLNSAMHRLLIWQFVGEQIAERPILGWGLDASRVIPGGHESVQGYSERLPLHPHNAALQMWLELGVMGGLLAMFIAAWPALRIERNFARDAQPAAAGAMAATAVIALLGFGIWQSWWIAAIGLVSALTIATLPARSAAG